MLPVGPIAETRSSTSIPLTSETSDSHILARYVDERELVANLLHEFGHNARRIESTDGIRGLCLLGELGDAGVCLYEERPDEFHRLAQLAGSNENTTRLIGAWSRFFDPSQSDRE